MMASFVMTDDSSMLSFKMAGTTSSTTTNNKTRNLKLDKICRACLEIKRDMRPLFEQLTATMLMGISKVQVSDDKINEIFLECIFVSIALTGNAYSAVQEQQSLTSRHLCLEVIQY